jgi:hypothetical protein
VIHPRIAGAAQVIPNWLLITLILMLASGWGILVWLECPKKKARAQPTEQ